MRARTELECTVADLRVAAERAGGKREELEGELATVQEQIAVKEGDLTALLPEYEAHRTRETDEKHRLDEARARLNALFAKRGRLDRFRTRAERDAYLRSEIASIEAYRLSHTAALEERREELTRAKEGLADVESRAEGAQERAEDGRQRARTLGEELAKLKDDHAELSERRKELWREDTKLGNLVAHAADELRTAERSLASMMDKVR